MSHAKGRRPRSASGAATRAGRARATSRPRSAAAASRAATGARSRAPRSRSRSRAGATRAGPTSTTRARSTRVDGVGQRPGRRGRAADARGRRVPRGPGPDHPARGVDLGGAAVLLVRRDRDRLVVRGARPATRRATTGPRRSPGASRSRAVGPARPAAGQGPRAAGALPQHDADLQAALADVDGRVVPVGVLGRPRSARSPPTSSAARGSRAWLGVQTAVLGTYLGSYTGVLLASTAVPVWARSRLFLGPIFIAHRRRRPARPPTGSCSPPPGLPVGHPTRNALGHDRDAGDGRRAGDVELQRAPPRAAGATRSRRAARARSSRPPSGWCAPGLGAALRALARRARGSTTSPACSTCSPGLAFRFAWVGAGRTSAQDHEAVARMHASRAWHQSAG